MDISVEEPNEKGHFTWERTDLVEKLKKDFFN